MGHKKVDKGISFAEVALLRSIEHNRSVEMMDRGPTVVDLKNRAALLREYYPIGQSHEGADAYPPLMLLKCMLLQKWFHIPSDPELANQINDRISFKKFLGLPFDKPSPDHSPFSRFRSGLSREAMIEIDHELLLQFARRGLSINEGIAIDARLVTSASRAVSSNELKKLKEKRATPEGRLDRSAKRLKFSRDLESDWTVRDDKPHYGLKQHACVDTTNGFILATTMTSASVHESTYLPYCAVASSHTQDPVKTVYADKGYYGRPNRGFLSLNGITDRIMRKDTTGATLTDRERERNRQLAKKRSIVEKYFGLSHLYDGTYRARFTTILKNIWDTLCREMAFNLFRGSKIILAT